MKNKIKLQKYLQDNHLEIYSTFGATDLDCSYMITDKDNGSWWSPINIPKIQLSFMYETYHKDIFTFDLDIKEVGMDENEFIKYIENELYLNRLKKRLNFP